MRAIFGYLRQHTLVWLVPVVVLALFLALLAWKAATSPATPFIYDL